MEETTPDGITREQIENTYEVLETLRENFNGEQLTGFAETVNEAHYLVQQYENSTEWQSYELPKIGTFAVDPEAPGGEKKVVIEGVYPGIAASEFVFETDTSQMTVSMDNPDHPRDAPVAEATYVEGGDKTYAFPVTRLDW